MDTGNSSWWRCIIALGSELASSSCGKNYAVKCQCALGFLTLGWQIDGWSSRRPLRCGQELKTCFGYGMYVRGGREGYAQRSLRDRDDEGGERRLKGSSSEAGEKKTSVRFMEADIYIINS
jgi:hypothetical protein